MGQRGTRIVDWLSARLNLGEIFSILTSFGLFYSEIDQRKPFREALDEAIEKPAPSYDRWPRVLGIIVVILIAVEIITGSLLAVYYLPTPESAHASVATIHRDVSFGWLVHEVHYWGAQFLIAVLLIRLIRFILQGVYRPPRELVWVFASLLLLVAFHFDLTGRLLPFTAPAYWSTVRTLETVRAVPIYGTVMNFFFGGGGTTISELTLIRSYVLHVAILPVAAVILIYLHFSTIRRVGLATMNESEEPVAKNWFHKHLIGMVIVLAVVIGVLVTFAVLAGTPFEAAADPYSTLPGARPPWYVLAPFGFLELTSGFLPRWIAGTMLLALFTLFVFPPYLGRQVETKRRKYSVLVFSLAVAAIWALLTWYGGKVA